MNVQFYQKLSHDLTELYEDDKYCDISIEAGYPPNNKIFRAHSLILSYRSSYFRRVLSRETSDGRIKSIKLKATCETVQIMLRYIYTGILVLEDQSSYDILNLLVITEKFCLQELVKHLQLYLLEHHTPWLKQNFDLIYRTSFQHETFQELQKFCNNIITKNPLIIFQSQDFTSIQENFLISLLQRDNLGMKEIQIWNHIIKWGIEQNPSLTDDPTNWSSDEFKALEITLRRCIPLIRFFELTSQEFYDKVRPYKRILSPHLYEDLMRHYMKPGSQLSSNILPSRMSRRRTSSFQGTKNSIIRPNPSPRPNSRPSSRPNSPHPEFRPEDIESDLITPESVGLLASWIGRKDYLDFDSPYEFRLLFRASEDGFSPINFHRICDNRQSTLVVIKIRGTGEIIGGYNPIRWKPLKGSWGNTEDSFIFSLRGPYNNSRSPILSRLNKGQNTYALNYEPNLGPSFGIADLKIEGNNFREENKCYCLKGCYEKSIRTTTGFFSIEDYEVFQVIRK
ncbi:hypothetical protein RclHR1_03670005 [Rhizophagus clarus]|uniref:Carbohydrate-binding module family 13 protein n=1 Tax=Rhizophagus clarus TaxID=94130 RepID=A0A2Z6RBQ6_9GLOM|nr:hypothetical protein RclHR1_03670005 [Rhizophagus clarus]GES88837.1 carbohydrate-binding module family 13 protein [Rhizophagus clarus]